MGRGRQKDYDIKEKRKQQRKEAKGEVYDKKKRTGTKSTLKKERNANKAVADSFKTASAINVDRKEEDKILDLIALLDGVSIEKPHVQFLNRSKVHTYTPETVSPNSETNISEGSLLSHPDDSSPHMLDAEIPADESEDVDEPNSASSSDDDGEQSETSHNDQDLSDRDGRSSSDSSSCDESDSDSDESVSQPSNAPAVKPAATEQSSTSEPTPTTMGRQKFIRKVIRDERRFVREQKLQQLLMPSAERVVMQLRRSLVAAPQPDLPTPSSTRTSSAAISINTAKPVGQRGAARFIPPPTTSTTTAKPTLSATVRVSAHFDKTGDGKNNPSTAKLMVLNRSHSIEDILTLLRGKLKATGSYSNGHSSGRKGYKYDAVRIVSTGELLSAFSLSTMGDGEAITLFSLAQDPELLAVMGQTTTTTEADHTTPTVAVPDAHPEPEGDPEPDAQSEPVTSPPPSPSCSTAPTAVPSYWTRPAATTQSIEEQPPAPCRFDSAEAESAYNRTIKATLTAAYKSEKYVPIREARKNLPIYHKRAEILETIAHNQVTVVSGETGSGKTTQLPLYILENMLSTERASVCNIVCTQPRRIAAVSVAERVHYESAQTGNTASYYIHYTVPD